MKHRIFTSGACSRLCASHRFLFTLVLFSLCTACANVAGPTDRALFAVAPDTIHSICVRSGASMKNLLDTADLCTLAGLIRASQESSASRQVCERTKSDCLSRNRASASELSLCPWDIVKRASRCTETDTVMARCLEQKVHAIAQLPDQISCEFAGEKEKLSLLFQILLGFPETSDCMLIRNECPSLFPFNSPQ